MNREKLIKIIDLAKIIRDKDLAGGMKELISISFWGSQGQKIEIHIASECDTSDFSEFVADDSGPSKSGLLIRRMDIEGVQVVHVASHESPNYQSIMQEYKALQESQKNQAAIEAEKKEHV